jgi:2-polyprenyl-6-methoxyphenol hydroxylase-like FAD-dependent oxidoreductase
MSIMTRRQYRHAVVIGASMGGLLAARVLAEHCEQVTLLDRDAFPPPGEQRKGVPQGRHAHVLLSRGREILEDFFPELTRGLVDQGALLGDVTADARWFVDGGYHQRFASGLMALCVSRPRLEAEVRSRLLSLPNVRAIERGDVLGLAANADGTRVTGVRLIRRTAGSAEEIVAADLVVDASGRGSRTPSWLESLGYAAPNEERVCAGIGYTTCLYRREARHLAGDFAAIVVATPHRKRGGVILAQEGDRWIVSLGGYAGDHAPSDEEGFLAFARSLAAPDIYEVLRDARPLSEPAVYKFPASQRRRYERLARFPDGLLVYGDAICSFNPIYGQGMTVATLEAVALQECLAEESPDLARRFFSRVAGLVDGPWSIAAGGDLRFPEVDGARSPAVRFGNWYLSKLHLAARRDAAVALAFQNVANLAAAPPSLLRPDVILRVARGNLRPVESSSTALMEPATAG